MTWPPLYELIGKEPFDTVSDDVLRVEVVRSADRVLMERVYRHAIWGSYDWVPEWIFTVASGSYEVTVTRLRDKRQWSAIVDWLHPRDRRAVTDG